MELSGSYYDGKSSDRYPVLVTREGGDLRMVGAGLDLRCAIKSVRLSAPLGRMRRSIFLPDGGVCEVEDGDALGRLLPSSSSQGDAWLHRWERSLGLALLALFLTIAVVAGFLHYGVPILARQVAFALPPETETGMGEQSLAFLDRALFTPTQLPHSRREELCALFVQLQSDLSGTGNYRLELRASKALGPNALALPAGIIVLTDEFVALAQHDEEIIAVLAHEFAHARQRHILRHVLQNSAVGVVVASLTGDLTSITSLGAALPTALVDARYSRQFEAEADDAALAYLMTRQIPPSRFAEILRRLQSEHDKLTGQNGDNGNTIGDLFSTHPETEARIRRALGE